MNSFEFGAGKDLWKAFDNCCAIVAGVYEGNAKSKLDKITLNINKGFTGGAIAFRFNTALKQLLSLPAFWSDASADQLLLYQTNPVGNFIAWKWAMQNLPGFSKRWQSRQVGDTRLMDTDLDWKLWRNKYMKYLSRGGMLANAFVDAVTVASGAKAVYETKKRRYKSIGYNVQLRLATLAMQRLLKRETSAKHCKMQPSATTAASRVVRVVSLARCKLIAPS